jgi:RND family efflux transporter MFP subunit
MFRRRVPGQSHLLQLADRDLGESHLRRMTSLSVTNAGIFAALLLGACGDGNQYVAPPPPKVTVAAPVQQSVTRYLEATGNVAAVNSADLVARVSGFLQSVNYQDGAEVKKGALLFTIEPEPYKVKLEQAKAAEAGADAVVKQNQSTLQRQSELLQKQNTSQASYDQALAGRDSAQASLDQAKANTAIAQINYDYANVTAPFDGFMTARQVSVGQ